jgi:DNA-binding NarL/FixJ family response regulator
MQKILIIEDHELMIDGISSLLQDEFDVTQAQTAEAMHECLKNTRVDLAILDLELHDGSSVTRTIKALHDAGVRVVIYSGTASNAILSACVNLNVYGFIDKRDGREILLAAMRAAAMGLQAFSARLKGAMGGQGVRNIKRLARVELAALNELFSEPFPTNKQIAGKLKVSEGRVEFLLGAISTKLGVNGRYNIVTEARKQGYCPEAVET